MTKDGESFCMADLIRRASVRKLRLHACACMRLSAPADLEPKWLPLVAVAERFADGEATRGEFNKARRSSQKGRRPERWAGDLRWAFEPDDVLRNTWAWPLSENQTFRPGDQYYDAALHRHRVFEELIAPDTLPAFSPAWRTDTAIALARTMYEAREFGAMPIMADALQDAGCDDSLILDHCRGAEMPHVRGCWVVDLVLGKV